MNVDGEKSLEQMETLKHYYKKLIIYFENELKKMPDGSINS